jgi:hypothetical protein
VTIAGPRLIRMTIALLTTAAALVVSLAAAPSSQAARGMELAIQDESVFVVGNKRWQGEKPFDYSRAIGVTRIRVNLAWAYTMNQTQYSTRNRPRVIQYDFGNIDALVNRAAQNGMRVHLSLTGPAPRWANSRKKQPQSGAWYKPNATEFGKWASVVAEHFRGRVDRYSIWNEPNWKTWLGPLSSGPSLYRSLYSRGYTAIKKADPRAKVLIGETSPYARPGMSTAPLAFLRAVTCVNKKYKRARNCTKLKADGYAHHPYDFRHAPAFQFPGEDNVTIGTLSRLTKALDKLSRAGVLRKNGGGRMPLYLTEYGYFASGKRALSPRLTSRYLQQAYSLALANGRVKSQLQYLLPTLPRSSDSAFNTGIVTQTGKRLPQYNALKRWYRANRGKVKRPGRALSLPAAPANPTD